METESPSRAAGTVLGQGGQCQGSDKGWACGDGEEGVVCTGGEGGDGQMDRQQCRERPWLSKVTQERAVRAPGKQELEMGGGCVVLS